MAYTKPMSTYALLLTLFTCQMLFGEGRQIKAPSGDRMSYIMSPRPRSIRKLGHLTAKSDLNDISQVKSASRPSSIDGMINQNNVASSKPTDNLSSNSQKIISFEANKIHIDESGNCPGVTCLDDFRPTAPGHSPGAGHFFATRANDPSDKKTENPQAEYTPSESEDDYRRTSPGRSPGAGHALKDENRESTPKSTELQSTFSSISQAQHSFLTESAERNKNVEPPSLPRSGDLATSQNNIDTASHCQSKKCTYDLLPTKPGNSPRVSHFFEPKSDSIASVHNVAHLGVASNTTPGHGPGAGHAILKETQS